MEADYLTFVWDENKNNSNQRKHRVSFEEARTVFYDDDALIIPDPDHSLIEERFIILGFSVTTRLLVVCYCYREDGTIIRLISARKATKTEEIRYTEMR